MPGASAEQTANGYEVAWKVTGADQFTVWSTDSSGNETLQAGIIVRDGRNFRFFAASDIFHPLEGQRFGSPKTAEQAALRRLVNLASRRPMVSGAGTAKMP